MNENQRYTASRQNVRWRGAVIGYGLAFAAGLGAMAWASGMFTAVPQADVVPASLVTSPPPNAPRPWLAQGSGIHGALASLRAALLEGRPAAPLIDPLRGPFQASHPNELSAIAAAAEQPVSAVVLGNELENMAGLIRGNNPEAPMFSRISWFFNHLVIIRDKSEPSPLSSGITDRAKLLIELGQPSEALALLKSAPGIGLDQPKAWVVKVQKLADALASIDRLAMVPTANAVAPMQPMILPAPAPSLPMPAPPPTGPFLPPAPIVPKTVPAPSKAQ